MLASHGSEGVSSVLLTPAFCPETLCSDVPLSDSPASGTRTAPPPGQPPSAPAEILHCLQSTSSEIMEAWVKQCPLEMMVTWPPSAPSATSNRRPGHRVRHH